MRVLTTWLRWSVLYRFPMGINSFHLPPFCGRFFKYFLGGFSSGTSRIAGFGEGPPQQDLPKGQNRRYADFGTVVESCSVTAADCPCLVFPYIERTGRGLRPAVDGLFSFRQYDAGTGLCCPLAAAFSLSAKDTFQRPPATRWTGIFQNFFRFCNARKGILATGGQRIFPFTPHTTAF